MCGILVLISVSDITNTINERIKLLSHRGPDSQTVKYYNNHMFAHSLLSIVGIDIQPYEDDDCIFLVNGEIYNTSNLQQKSDSSSVKTFYKQYKKQYFANFIDGVFALVYYDKKKKEFIISRDIIGVIPLYISKIGNVVTGISSEIKAISGTDYPSAGVVSNSASQEAIEGSLDPETVEASKEAETLYYPPGCTMILRDDGSIKQMFSFKETFIKDISFSNISYSRIKYLLTNAVIKRLFQNKEKKYAFLLSGGLDSSIIATIGRLLVPDGEIHTFSIGLKDSPDLKYARIMANNLRSIHHEVIYTEEEGFAAIPDVIKYVETYDVTTIRASTPMYLLGKEVQRQKIRVILSGEGADELFGGYLYFKHAPSLKEFDEEIFEKVFNLHKYDCLRANKSMMASGVETRVPFLDKQFMKYILGIDPVYKKTDVEKYILRMAFDGLLPKEILWRVKEQFSDGVGYGWIDYIKNRLTELGTTEKEYYKQIFDSMYKNCIDIVPAGQSIACSTDKAAKWIKGVVDDPTGLNLKK